MNCIIDRLEGAFAVVELENGSHADMPRVLLPAGATEGDTLVITVDKAATEQRKKRVSMLMANLFED